MPPRLARLLAVLAALALVGGAFVLRGALSGDDTDEDARGEQGGPGDGGDDDDGYVVLCDADLGEAACAAVADLDGVGEVEVVALGEVLERATDETPLRADLWFTLDPMPGVLDTARREEQLPPLTQGTAVPVASSSLALLARPELLPSACDEATPTWDCLTEPVRPALAIPGSGTSFGTIAIAAGATGLQQGDTGYGISAYDGTEEADALRDLVDDSPSGAGSTLARQARAMLQRGTAFAAVSTEGLATLTAATPQGAAQDLAALALAPEVVVGVVLIGLGGEGSQALARVGDSVTGQTVRDALADAGWTPSPASSSGLPEADLVYALREELG